MTMNTNTRRWGLLCSTLALLGSGCVLDRATLEDGEETGNEGFDEAEEGKGEVGDESTGDASDECLSFGTNVDGTTPPPGWALYPEYDVTCEAGFGHEQIRLEPIEWTRTIEVDAIDVESILDVLVGATSDGGALVVMTPDRDQHSPAIAKPPILAHYSATGQLEWTQQLAEVIGFPRDLVGDGADRFYIAAGSPDGGRLVAIDADGDLLWSRSFAGFGIHGLTLTDAGVAITLVTHVESDDEPESTTLLAYDAEGTELWSEPSAIELGHTLAQLPDGGFVITSMDGFVRHDESGQQVTDAALVEWPADIEFLYNSAAVSGGRIFVGGTRYDLDANELDLGLLELDVGEQELVEAGISFYQRASSWAKKSSMPDDPNDHPTAETVNKVVAMPDGGVVVLGSESSGQADKVTPLMIRVDSEGEVSGFDRGFWEGAALHGAVSPDGSLFVVTTHRSEGHWDRVHLRKYGL